jgi:lipid-binding SYLF domain-containing protein
MNIESQMRSAARHLRKELREIPGLMLKHCRGIVFLTLLKGAFIWSGSLSTGIVIKRLSPTQWSPPCSLGMASFGFGLQAGGEKVDIIIIIADDQEIDTFAGTGQLKLGVEYGLAAGVRKGCGCIS